ncbi:MAG: aminotransferase class V-fold PLP-dependent enzyme [Myxococcota bacterium]
MIYLDYHAATPLSEAAREAMARALNEGFGNASSAHRAGRNARGFTEAARDGVATALGGSPADVVLTSGGTEACQLMVRGMPRPTQVITGALEHPAIVAACDAWKADGVEVRVVDVEVELELPAGALVALQWVNHETGRIASIERWAARCKAAGATLVVDAIQAFGRIPIDVSALGAHALAVASHKVGGPCAGAVWVARDVDLQPQLGGGGQERGRRGGSQDAVGHAGFAAACGAIETRLEAMETVARWRDDLEAVLVELGASINDEDRPRVASVVDASVPGWRGEVLVAALDLEGVCASAGAACSSGVQAASPVLQAIYPEEPWRATSALRLSLGPESLDDAAIATAIETLRRVVPRKG